MAKVAKPRQELIFLWRKAGNELTYPEISRAYARINTKFVPTGWYLEDIKGTTLMFTDKQVENVDFSEAMRIN